MTNIQLTSETVQAADALAAIELFHERGWTDGLPVVPPTAEAVAAFLGAASLAPDRVLGVEPTKGMVITAEKAAANAVMAGCLPEHMPVIAAAVEAMTAEEFSLHAITVSTMGAGILLVVTGPIADQLGINSGVSAFGPGCRANAAIGRAIRLVVMNVLDTRPGVLDKATIGHPGKYSWCIGEAAEHSPWAPLHVARGLPEGSSGVTVFAGLSPFQVGQHAANTPEGVLDSFIDPLFAMGAGMAEVLILLCPEHVQFFRQAGWPRSRVGEYLYDAARRPAAAWAAAGRPAAGVDPESEEPVSALASPDAVMTVVVGGAGGGWSAVVPTWSFGHKSRVVTRPIATG